MREQGARLMQELNRSNDDRLVLESEYVLVLASKNELSPDQ
jgi:hypothetical protein